MKLRPNPKNDDSPYGWIITPSTNLVLFVVDEMVLAGITERSMMSYSSLPTFLRAAKHAISEHGIEASEAFDRLAEFSKDDAQFAAAEVESGFDTTFKHHSVAIWAAIETNVESTIENILQFDADSRAKLLANFSSATDKQRKRLNSEDPFIARKTFTDLMVLKPVMQRYISMLSILGAECELPDEVVHALDEMGALRNTIMHNAGFVDGLYLDKVPWAQEEHGDYLSIDREKAARFFHAAGEFTKEFSRVMVNYATQKIASSH